MKTIFVNLPVKDVERSRGFFGGLGFSFNPVFSNADAICMIVSEAISVMLVSETRFRDFITGDISDTSKGTEVLICLSADSRADVDAKIESALANGGKPWKPVMEYGSMYSCSFQDPDGHVWEILHMPETEPA